MAIASLDQYLAAGRFNMTWFKSGSRTTVAAQPFSTFDVAGDPVGTLAIGNTTTGVIHTDDINGYPKIPALGSANVYISRIEFGSTVACRFRLFDRLWSAGAMNANTNGTITFSSQPALSRVPANNYIGLEIWYECVTAVTGNQSLKVDFINQAGEVANTGTVAFGMAPVLGRMYRLPMSPGSTGVQYVNAVTGTVSTAGTFNIHIMRPIWTGRVPIANFCDVHDMLRTGMPLIYDNSALFVVTYCDSTSLGVPEITIEIAYA